MTRFSCAIAIVTALSLSSVGLADHLPQAARDAIAATEEDVQGMRAEVERRIEMRRAEMLEKLKQLQDQFTREAKLDEAVAIRDAIRRLGGAFAVGSKVHVLWGGTWWDAQVVEVKDGKWLIQYDGYDAASNEWVDATRIKHRAADAGFPAGTKVDIEWKGTWYPGEVIEAKEGKWHIKYDGYDDGWNEWIDAARIRQRTIEPTFPAGTKVDVEWGGTWWAAQVIEAKDGKWLIQYDGYDESWNEWIDATRIRARTVPPPELTKRGLTVQFYECR